MSRWPAQIATIFFAWHAWRVVVLLVLTSPLAAATHDERFLQGLRERRMFTLAERYCTERLLDSGLSDSRRAELTIELSRSLAEHAVQAAPAERAPLWQKAREVVDEFARTSPRSPRLLVVRVQGSLALLAQGEIALQEVELTGVGAESLEASRTSLRSAVALLKQLHEETSAELIKRSRVKAEPGQLTAAELASLQSNLRYELSRAFRNQALSYPPDSADRINALTQALEMLAPLAKGPADDPLTWTSRLDEVLCCRLLRDYAAAVQRLAAISAETTPPEMGPRILAEAIRLGLARGRIDEVAPLAERADPGASTVGLADLDLARLEAYLAAWQRATERRLKAEAADWERKSTDQLEHIDERHGSYWARRAEALLARAMGKSPAVENVEALVRAAAGLYRNGQIDEALAAYDRAASQAHARTDLNGAFDLALTAATIEAQRKRFDAAAVRYRKLALAMPDHPRSGEAHLLAIYNTGQGAQTAAAPDLTEYAQLLDEHLKRWPRSPTAGQAAWWLGVLRENSRDWPAAIAVYRQVLAAHAEHVAAIEGLARCYLEALAEARAAGQDPSALRSAALQYFEGLTNAPSGQPQKQPTTSSRAGALAAARIELDNLPAGAPRAETFLRNALSSAADASSQWQSEALTLLVAAQAGQRKSDAAAQSVARLQGSSASELVSSVDLLGRIALAAPPEVRRDLTDVRLRIAALAREQQLSPPQLLLVDRVQAAALVDAGRRTEALALWQALAKNNPNDGRVQEDLATLLLEGPDRATLQSALTKWREIQTKSRPGSPRWFRAGYSIARAYVALGERRQAQEAVQRVAAAHPELGGAATKQKFLKLLTEIEK